MSERAEEANVKMVTALVRRERSVHGDLSMERIFRTVVP